MRDPSGHSGRGQTDLSPLIGRRDALQRIIRVVENTRVGNLDHLILVGPSGIGKTRLLTEAARYAEWRGVPVLNSVMPSLSGSLQLALLLVDDAPDPSSANLQQHSVLATTRPGEEAMARAFPSAERILLGPLNEAESIELIHSMCRSTKILIPHAEWIQQTVRKARGNPTALQRLTRAWAKNAPRVAMPRGA